MYDTLAFTNETVDGGKTYLEWEGKVFGLDVGGATILTRNAAGLIENIRLYRHIASLRSRRPEPEIFLHPDDAATIGVTGGEWVEVSTIQGRCKGRTAIRDDMPKGLVRVPHGWWKPEMPKGKNDLSGAWEFADAQICPDDDDYLDLEQGIPHLKGLACAVHKLPTRPAAESAAHAVPELVPAK